MNSAFHTAWQQKVFTKSMGLRYRIHYCRGLENGVADALSRRGPPAELLAISSPTHDWLQELYSGMKWILRLRTC